MDTCSTLLNIPLKLKGRRTEPHRSFFLFVLFVGEGDIKKGRLLAAISGNPCNWVPYDKTVHWTVLSTFLVFANAIRFRFLRKAT